MYCPVQFIEVAEKNCTLGSLDQEFDQNFPKNYGLLCRVGDIQYFPPLALMSLVYKRFYLSHCNAFWTGISLSASVHHKAFCSNRDSFLN
jgi:hypothetical protein